MRARLHVRGSQLGFFREGTHTLCDPRQTRQLLPATCDVLDRIGSVIRSSGLEAVREIELTENADASARVIAVDATSPLDQQAIEHIAAVEGVTGVVWGRRALGDPHVIDTIEIDDAPRMQLRRHVLAFFQGNRFLLSPLAAYVSTEIPQRSVVIDLYAGGGLFSVVAAISGSARVTAVEGDRVAAGDLAANSQAISGIMALHQPVEQYLADLYADRRRGDRSENPIVIVDPRARACRKRRSRESSYSAFRGLFMSPATSPRSHATRGRLSMRGLGSKASAGSTSSRTRRTLKRW